MPIDLEPLVLRLAEEFKARDMRTHLARLRRFYAARKRRKRAQVLSKEPIWDEDMVVGWLCLFRIAPFDRVYQVRAPGEPCECGHKGTYDGSAVFTVCAFPGGSLSHCQACGRSWLRLDDEPDR